MEQASRPSIALKTVTALARSVQTVSVDDPSLAARPEVEILRSESRDEQRPGGRRFGALVHGLLATIEIGDSADRITKAAAVQGRLVGANDAERIAAVVAVRRALATPILRRAGDATEVRRESPVLMKRDDGTLLEGVVDLAFREDDGAFSGWTIVDFKTDREFDGASAQYLEQVRLYCEAVAKATGRPTRGRLLVV